MRYAADQTDYRPEKHIGDFRRLPCAPRACFHHEKRLRRSGSHSIETYEEMLDCIATDKAIADAEQEIAAGGQLLDAKETLGALRRKYFG